MRRYFLLLSSSSSSSAYCTSWPWHTSNHRRWRDVVNKSSPAIATLSRSILINSSTTEASGNSGVNRESVPIAFNNTKSINASHTRTQFFSFPTHHPSHTIFLQFPTMTTTKSLDESPLAQFNFPRTGKRGVPQQFPRHLYEMLDCESRLIETDANHARIISWSDSGRAFRIYNVSEFSLSILPRYFRTKKFSSFQRNLNLVSCLLDLSGFQFFVTVTCLTFCFWCKFSSMALPRFVEEMIWTCMPILLSSETIPSRSFSCESSVGHVNGHHPSYVLCLHLRGARSHPILM